MKALITELNKIQKTLKAPKSQYNSFGKYNYRNCEDILEAVKPLIPEGFSLMIGDKIVMMGGRFYVKATATFTDGEHSIKASAFARESEEKKGMDSSQVTGAASSYARKYCLNGLFLIDDTKDSDSQDNSKIDIIEELKKKVDKIRTIEELKEFYLNNQGYGAEFDKYVTLKKAELNK